MRLTRKAGLLYNERRLTLAALFADATVVEDPYYGGYALAGVNDSGSSSATIIVPENTTVYILAFHGQGFCIGKVLGTSYTAFKGNATPTLSTYGPYIRVALSIRNGTMVAVTFPNFSEEEVDAALGAINQQQIYAGNSSSLGTRSTPNSSFNDSGLYVVAHGSNCSMSISAKDYGMEKPAKDELLTPIFSCCTDNGTPNTVYLFEQGDKMYLSSNGTSAARLYGGRISRLY